MVTGVGSLCPGVRYRSRDCFANYHTASKLIAERSRSTAKKFFKKWRSSHQAPPSACAIPRMKVSGKSKLSSPHLNSRQIPKIENTLAQKLSTLNSHLSTLIFQLSQPYQGVPAVPKPCPVRLQRSSLTPPLQQGNLIAASFLLRAQVALLPLRQRFRRFHLHSPSASPLLPHRVKPSSRTNQS